jgi:putative PIN family toxin of toxin-antitoxin system
VLSVTADTNIYISALNFGGPPDRVLDLARAGVVRLAISDEIREEVVRILRFKFSWNNEAIQVARDRISDFTEHVFPLQVVVMVEEDPSDNRILECAKAAGSEYIVTGDQHLLKLGHFGNAKIVKPAEFLEIQLARKHEL